MATKAGVGVGAARPWRMKRLRPQAGVVNEGDVRYCADEMLGGTGRGGGEDDRGVFKMCNMSVSG